jgi:hypothetical protein
MVSSLTPPCSQKRSTISKDSKSVSRDSRPLEIAHSSSSLQACSADDITVDDSASYGKLLQRILTAVEDMVDQCRVCWVSKEVSQPHFTYRCHTKACSGIEWKAFKSELRFPPGVLCFFCFASFDPPFNHERAPRQTPVMCKYPDALKELVYLLYHDESLREKVFSKLGISKPTSLQLYKQYITKMQVGGIIGVYKVIDAYLDIRRSE